MHDFMLENRRGFVTNLTVYLGATSGLIPNAWAHAAPIRIAAAADLKFVLTQLGAQFERATGLKLAVTYGSSGNLARQIEQGLPIEVFMSADESLVFRLQQAGWAQDAGVVYARGRLAWVVPHNSAMALDAQLQGLRGFQAKLAIANPDFAPYGRAARSALQATALWEKLQPHLVLADNVSQATQFVSMGATQAGLVSLSLAAAPELSGKLRYAAVNPSLHPPIIQRMGLAKAASPAARRWTEFVQSEAAQRIFAQHGLGSV